MLISKNIFIHKRLQKRKMKLEQNFLRKKLTKKKEIEIEKTAKK